MMFPNTSTFSSQLPSSITEVTGHSGGGCSAHGNHFTMSHSYILENLEVPDSHKRLPFTIHIPVIDGNVMSKHQLKYCTTILFDVISVWTITS